MKVQYNREDDVLTIHLSDGAIDHAEETDGGIARFSPSFVVKISSSQRLAFN